MSVFIIGGTDLFIAQYIQLVHGVSPFITGLWLLPGIVGLIVGSLLAPSVARTVRPGVVIAAGLVIAALGAIVFHAAKLAFTHGFVVAAAVAAAITAATATIAAITLRNSQPQPLAEAGAP